MPINADRISIFVCAQSRRRRCAELGRKGALLPRDECTRRTRCLHMQRDVAFPTSTTLLASALLHPRPRALDETMSTRDIDPGNRGRYPSIQPEKKSQRASQMATLARHTCHTTNTPATSNHSLCPTKKRPQVPGRLLGNKKQPRHHDKLRRGPSDSVPTREPG